MTHDQAIPSWVKGIAAATITEHKLIGVQAAQVEIGSGGSVEIVNSAVHPEVVGERSGRTTLGPRAQRVTPAALFTG